MSDGRVLHFFAGKGGVGKTTLATAYALTLAEKYPKEKILLVSSDASGSLTDLPKKKVSGKASKLSAGKGSAGLFAAEYDPSAATAPFLKDYEPALRAAAGKGALLSEDDLQKILSKTLPGIEDLVFLSRCSSNSRTRATTGSSSTPRRPATPSVWWTSPRRCGSSSASSAPR